MAVEPEDRVMHVIRRRGWEIPERLADLPDPTAGLYPVKQNEKFTLDRPVTDEKINTNYNNFYEFGPTKSVARAAQALKLRPWTIKIDGMVEKPQDLDIDDLLKKVTLEERLYRHRCVEAWSMAIPWSGFPLAKLVELAQPLSSAKYLRMETFFDKTMAPEQRKAYYPWPYVEGLTMAEATTNSPSWLPALTASRCRKCRVRHCVWRCRGDTASSRSSRSSSSPSPISGRRAIGRRCRRRNTASGPT